jgi:hypothetical protein
VGHLDKGKKPQQGRFSASVRPDEAYRGAVIDGKFGNVELEVAPVSIPEITKEIKRIF